VRASKRVYAQGRVAGKQEERQSRGRAGREDVQGFREVKLEVQGEATQASSKAGLEEGRQGQERQGRKGGKAEREASWQPPGTDHTSCPPPQGIQKLVQGGRREQGSGWGGW
jgi:hypothetical protein